MRKKKNKKWMSQRWTIKWTGKKGNGTLVVRLSSVQISGCHDPKQEAQAQSDCTVFPLPAPMLTQLHDNLYKGYEHCFTSDCYKH